MNVNDVKELARKIHRINNFRIHYIPDSGLAVYGAKEILNDATKVQTVSAAILSQWSQHGFPMVQCGHKLAAALMSTSTARQEVYAPWGAFGLEVPRGLVYATDGQGNQDAITMLVAVQVDDRWGFTVVGDNSNLMVWNRSLDYIRDNPCKDPGPEDLRDYSIREQDERALIILSRYLLNVCMEMTDPTREHIYLGSGARLKTAVNQPLPISTYRLGRPVTIDLRDTITHYITGKSGARSAPTTRWLTIGHWRSQPYGERSSLRKRIWVQPYWSGVGEVREKTHILKKSIG